MVKVADYVAKFLESKDIKHVFTVTGGGAMFLNDGLAKNTNIKGIFHHHEQACAMAAVGYSKVNNKIAVVMPTTGCGGTNTITFRIFTATAIGVTPTSTLFVVTITGTNLTGFFYNASVAVNAGVYILMQISYSGGNNNNAHDISCQIDLF